MALTSELSSTPNLKTKSSLSGYQDPVAALFSSFLQQGAFKGLPAYGGDIIAPLIPEMQQALSLISQYAPGAFEAMQDTAMQRALSGEPAFDVSPEETARLFEKGVSSPMLREFDRSIRPRISESFAGGGGLMSSRRAELESRELSDLNKNHGAQLAQTQLSNQQLQAQLAESAAGRQFQAAQAPSPQLGQAMNLTAAAAPFQSFAQQQAQSRYGEFLRTQPSANPLNELALGFLQNPQTVTYNPGMPFWQQMLLGGMGAAGQAAAGGAFGGGGGASGGASAGGAGGSASAWRGY